MEQKLQWQPKQKPVTTDVNPQLQGIGACHAQNLTGWRMTGWWNWDHPWSILMCFPMWNSMFDPCLDHPKLPKSRTWKWKDIWKVCGGSCEMENEWWRWWRLNISIPNFICSKTNEGQIRPRCPTSRKSKNPINWNILLEYWNISYTFLDLQVSSSIFKYLQVSWIATRLAVENISFQLPTQSWWVSCSVWHHAAAECRRLQNSASSKVVGIGGRLRSCQLP